MSIISVINANKAESSDLEITYSLGSGLSVLPVKYSGEVPSFCAIKTMAIFLFIVDNRTIVWYNVCILSSRDGKQYV